MNKVLKGIRRFGQDNNVNPWSTCFPASVAMALSFHIATKLGNNFDNELVKAIIKNKDEHQSWLKKHIGKWTISYMPYQVFAFWTRYIKKEFPGLTATYVKKDIAKYKEILLERPLVVSTTLTHAGHIVVLVGFDTVKDGFFVLDPFGKAPYKTDEEKSFDQPYFIDGYGWLKNHGLDIC